MDMTVRQSSSNDSVDEFYSSSAPPELFLFESDSMSGSLAMLTSPARSKSSCRPLDSLSKEVADKCTRGCLPMEISHSSNVSSFPPPLDMHDATLDLERHADFLSDAMQVSGDRNPSHRVSASAVTRLFLELDDKVRFTSSSSEPEIMDKESLDELAFSIDLQGLFFETTPAIVMQQLYLALHHTRSPEFYALVQYEFSQVLSHESGVLDAEAFLRATLRKHSGFVVFI